MARASNTALLLDISTQLAAMQTELRHMTEAQGRTEQSMLRADESRRRIHSRLDHMQRELGETKHQAALTAEKVAEMAPLVVTHEQRYQRRLGKRQLIANQKTAIVGLVTGGAWLAAKLSPLGTFLPDWLARLLWLRP